VKNYYKIILSIENFTQLNVLKLLYHSNRPKNYIIWNNIYQWHAYINNMMFDKQNVIISFVEIIGNKHQNYII
jgi:hypothetical protein